MSRYGAIVAAIAAAAATTNTFEQLTTTTNSYHTSNNNHQKFKNGKSEVTKFEMHLVANTQIMMETNRKCTGILNMRF